MTGAILDHGAPKRRRSAMFRFEGVETFAHAATRAGAGRFDQMRLAAATLVIASHSFEITQGDRRNEPFLRLTGELTFGELAVLIFFALSGYLLAQSWMRDPDAGRFAMRRVRRIFPALALCVSALVLIVGPALTALPLNEYFMAPQTWVYFSNLALAAPAGALPGVFGGASANAPMWTLGYEVACYAILAALGGAGRLGPRGALFTACALFALHPLTAPFLAPGAALALRPLCLFGAVFFAAAALALVADKAPRDRRLAGFAVAAFIVCALAGRPAFGFLAFGVYATLFAATSRPTGLFARLARGTDASYGVYLWGWPAQHALVALGVATTPLLNIALAVPLSLIAGFASWRLVERRFLRPSRSMNFQQNSRRSA